MRVGLSPSWAKDGLTPDYGHRCFERLNQIEKTIKSKIQYSQNNMCKHYSENINTSVSFLLNDHGVASI